MSKKTTTATAVAEATASVAMSDKDVLNSMSLGHAETERSASVAKPELSEEDKRKVAKFADVIKRYVGMASDNGRHTSCKESGSEVKLSVSGVAYNNQFIMNLETGLFIHNVYRNQVNVLPAVRTNVVKNKDFDLKSALFKADRVLSTTLSSRDNRLVEIFHKKNDVASLFADEETQTALALGDEQLGELPAVTEEAPAEADDFR